MAETDSESKSSSSPPPNNTPNIIQYPYPPGWISPPPNNTPNIIQYLESLHPPIYHNFIQSCLTNFLRLVLLQLVLQPQAASPPWFHTKPKAAELGAANQKQKKPQLRKRRHPLREVAEKIVEYLVHNGIEGRGWEGVEQQVRHLEGKFRDALRWKMQTGEGIMETAREKDNAARRERDSKREVQRELGINEPDDDEAAEDFVGAAINETEAAIKKICPFFFELESVFMDRASAVSLHLAESGVADDPSQIREALRLINAEGGDSDGDLDIEPETQPPSSQPLRYDVPSSTQPPSSQPLRSVPSSTLSPGMSASARSSASSKRVRSDAENSGNTPAIKSNAERIFPSKEEMDAQRTEDQSLARERLENDKRLVEVTAQVAESLKPPTASSEVQSVQIRKNELDLTIQSYDFELRKGAKDLERKQSEMNFTKAASELAAVNLRADTEKINLQKAQVELRKAEVEAEQAKAHSQALTRAKMIQDFLRAGVSLADAIATTTQLLEMPK
ncbi:hypothetical protein MJO28_009399 [Puccinia striiformis f. sp. tritici]|uniref:Uncharacterized protein n=1 Tax=Puccinia striiformis f. sp. tritici TaxID=168172 RepID=A0ACC0E6Z9_9BASI|nr:hypothetical protein MJO28_009399 [Puccinia striiformis f. sp. tritici]